MEPSLDYDIAARGRGITSTKFGVETYKRRLLARWERLLVACPKDGDSSANLRIIFARNCVIDTSALYHAYATRNENYLGLLLSDRAPPLNTQRLLERLECAELQLSARGATRARLEGVYSQTAYNYWLRLESNRLRERFFKRTSTIVTECQLLERQTFDAYGFKRVFLAPLPDDELHEESEIVNVLVVQSELLLPPSRETARIAWTSVLDEDDAVHIVFPSIWHQAIEWHRRNLSDNAQPMRNLELSKKAVELGNTGISLKAREARDELLRTRREIVAAAEAKLEMLYIDAARRSHHVLREWLCRAGYSTPTESVGLAPGGMCGNAYEVLILRAAADSLVDKPGAATTLGKPWPPRRGADSLAYAMTSWVGSRTMTGGIRVPTTPFPLELLYEDDDSDDEYCDDEKLPTLSYSSRRLLAQHKSIQKRCLLPRVYGNNLNFYQVARIVDYEHRTNPDPVEDLSEVLCGLSDHDLPNYLRNMQRLLRTQSCVSKVVMEAQRRWRAVVALHARRHPSSALVDFVNVADSDVLEMVLARLNITDLCNLRCASRVLSRCESVKSVLPRVVFSPTAAWQPSKEYDNSIVFRSCSQIELPLALVYKRLCYKGTGCVEVPIHWACFFKSPPQITCHMVFDAPGAPCVPCTSAGPPMRLVGRTLDHDTMSLDLDEKGKSQAVRFSVLSSNYTGAFTTNLEAELAAARRVPSPTVSSRLVHKLEGIRKRNAVRQHFRIVAKVDAEGASFEAVSPPFLVSKRPKCAQKQAGQRTVPTAYRALQHSSTSAAN